MREWFDNLPRREQAAILVMAAVVLVWLVYMLLWSPLAAQREQLRQRNAAELQRLQRVDTMVAEIALLRDQSGNSDAQRNLAALVNRSTRENDLQVARLQPNTRGGIEVRFENVPVSNLLRWMHSIEYREGLSIPDASINLAGDGGRVNAAVRIGGGA